jgi:hypothetical protein
MSSRAQFLLPVHIFHVLFIALSYNEITFWFIVNVSALTNRNLPGIILTWNKTWFLTCLSDVILGQEVEFASVEFKPLRVLRRLFYTWPLPDAEEVLGIQCPLAVTLEGSWMMLLSQLWINSRFALILVLESLYFLNMYFLLTFIKLFSCLVYPSKTF